MRTKVVSLGAGIILNSIIYIDEQHNIYIYKRKLLKELNKNMCQFGVAHEI